MSEQPPTAPPDEQKPGDPAPEPKKPSLIEDLGAAGPLALVSATLPALGGFALLGTLHIVGPWLRDHEVIGVVMYITGFALLAGFALLPTYAQAILGGWAFGLAVGTPAAIAGFLGAAIIAYALAKRVAGEDVERTLEHRPEWRAVRDEIVGGGFWKTLGMVTLLRLPLNSPFALTNLVLSAARTPFIPYAIGTAIGMTPRTAGAVWLATQIKGELTKDAMKDAKPSWFLPVAIVSVIVVFIIITHVGNKAIKRVAAKQRTDVGVDETATNARGSQSRVTLRRTVTDEIQIDVPDKAGE